MLKKEKKKKKEQVDKYNQVTRKKILKKKPLNYHSFSYLKYAQNISDNLGLVKNR